MTDSDPHKLDVATLLAIERTHVAHERTMMAWIRTALSLIMFGFTVYKYFQLQGAPVQNERLIGPPELALILIGLGLFSLSVAVVQNRQNVRRMRALSSESPRSLAGMVAGLVALLGVLAVIAVIMRL